MLNLGQRGIVRGSICIQEKASAVRISHAEQLREAGDGAK